MIITFSGKPGSGKSTVARIISKKLNLKYYSMGEIQRKYAKEHGMTIEEFGRLEAKDDKIDREVDAYQTELAKKEDNLIIDGRLSFHFIPESIKVFFDCHEDISAERIHKDNLDSKRDESERKTKTVDQAKDVLLDRMEINRQRFIKYYGVDFLDTNNYDLILDTSNISVEQAVEKVLEFVKKKHL